ncbi:MAG: EamA family transporter [Chloroflexota bacterium]
MSGSGAAILCAVGIAASTVFIRRALVRTPDPFLGIIITIIVALPVLVSITALTENIGNLIAFPWEAYLVLAAAGVLHFILGRVLYYGSIHLVGANITQILVSPNPIYAVILGIILFQEPLTWRILLGTPLIIAGCVLVTWRGRQPNSDSPASTAKTLSPLKKGLIFSIVAGLCFGLSPVLIKLGLLDGGSPALATLVSYIAAAMGLTTFLGNRDIRKRFRHIDRAALIWFTIAGLAVAFAHWLRYMAVSLTPVSIVTPLVSTSVLFVLLFSFLINRKLETFAWNVIAGAIFVAAGASLIY